jgi:hypothetical protein
VKKATNRNSTPPAPLLGDATIRRLAFIDAAGVIACIISRPPTLFSELKIPLIDVKLDLNAGYILVFGPLVIFLAGIVTWYLVPRTPTQRGWTPSDRRVAAVLFGLLPIICAFISLQFFLLLAPPGTCPSFDRWRYLVDFRLSAFKPEYCMGLPSATQERMPWLIEPPIVQAWAQVLFPMGAAVTMLQAWRSWLPRFAVPSQ